MFQIKVLGLLDSREFGARECESISRQSGSTFAHRKVIETLKFEWNNQMHFTVAIPFSRFLETGHFT